MPKIAGFGLTRESVGKADGCLDGLLYAHVLDVNIPSKVNLKAHNLLNFPYYRTDD